jgi:hypothetical protein
VVQGIGNPAPPNGVKQGPKNGSNPRKAKQIVNKNGKYPITNGT